MPEIEEPDRALEFLDEVKERLDRKGDVFVQCDNPGSNKYITSGQWYRVVGVDYMFGYEGGIVILVDRGECVYQVNRFNFDAFLHK